MFGSSSIDCQQSALSIINSEKLTPAQKSAYCFDRGICDKCGVKTHWVGPFKRRPYTNERVWDGICRTCRPEEIPAEAAGVTTSSSPALINPSQMFGQLQKMAVPPEVLLAHTATAFQAVGKGVKAGATTVKGGIGTLNDNIQKEFKNSTANGTSRGLNVFGHNATRTSGSLSDQQQQQPSQQPNLQQQQSSSFSKTEFASLKNRFQTNENTPKEGDLLLDDTTVSSAESDTSSSQLQGEAMKGKLVKTPFGKGQVVDYRSDDDIYVIDLHSNKNLDMNGGTAAVATSPPTNTKLFCKKESFSMEHPNLNRQKQAMELNEAYESLEKMRRLNLELECQERGVAHCDFDMCTMCLLHGEPQHEQDGKKFHRIRKFVRESQKNLGTQKKATPCLFCAAPTCVDHSSPAFRKENITSCLECCKLFESEYVVDCINQAHGVHEMTAAGQDHSEDTVAMRVRPLDHMMDLYDRVLLLLQYSSQYIESIAAALEENTKKYNNVNVGASSAGIASGALGIAAAAAIFTPAGPPLLVASLLLGGGATTVQTGTEVVNYFSEPNKFADKIIVLVGMLHSLLKVKENLREILTARLLEQEGNPEIERLKKSLHELREKQREAAFRYGTTVASTAVLGGVAMAGGGVAMAEVAAGAAGAATLESAAIVSSVEVGTLAGRNANMLSKSGTAIARGARFARFAGGALSAATLALEARTLNNTLEQIKAGNPCEKADTLRRILKELPLLPTTEQLDDECRIYIGAMSNRVNATALEDAINLIESKAIQEWQVTKSTISGGHSDPGDEMAPAGASILDGEDTAVGVDDANDELALFSSALRDSQNLKRNTETRVESGESKTPEETNIV